MSIRGISLTFFSFFLTISFSGLAQEEKEEEPSEVKEANEAYESQQYFRAVELLKDAYGEVRGRQGKGEILFKTANSYRMMNEYKDAARYFERTVKIGYNDHTALLYWGDMLQAQGEYEEAIEVYQRYVKAVPDTNAGQQAIENARLALKWKEEPSRYQVEIMPDINSEAMDFAPIYGGDRRDNRTILFASSREESEGNDEDAWLGQSFFDIYTSSAERKGRRRRRGKDEEKAISYADLRWSTPVPVDEEELINTEEHEGVAAYDSRKDKLFFTRCKQEKNKQLGCEIYRTEKQGRSWREPEKQIIGTDTMANVGHPSLSPDDKYLYFVSDDFNTSGKHDIFLTTYDRREKRWKKPTNLGTIVNTPNEEYFPVVHGDGYLYFASNGHGGMGGLDVFRVKLNDQGLPEGEVENMKYPINSSKDDFALNWKPGKKTQQGFVSSNRDGGEGGDDIYSVYRTPLIFNIEGVVTDDKTGKTIPNAEVVLDGSDGTSLTVTADADGYYIFDDTKLEKGNTYKLSFKADQYLTGTSDASTVGVPLSSFDYVPSAKYFINRIKVNKALDPIEEPIVLPNVFFDLGKWDLRPEAMQALDSVVAILRNNPQIVIEMRSHTDYRDDERSNLRLSQKRADTTVSYLISKGINSKRLVAKGMGESDPFTIPENYSGYGEESLPTGVTLTERYIKTLSPEKQEIANQINRRTDFKVLRDDFVPADAAPDTTVAPDAQDIISKKREEAMKPGKIYVLKRPMSFGRIANQFDLNIRELKDLNGGLRGVRPFAGLQLKVEKDGNYAQWDKSHYQIRRRGADWRSLEKKTGVDRKKLEELNPDVDEDMLKPGFYLRTKPKKGKGSKQNKD